MANVMDLGQSAKTGTLFATSQVLSSNFSQPEQVIGTAAASVTTATQVWTAGINKYVFYYTLTTATAVSQNFTITGIPANLLALYSSITQAASVASVSFGTKPLLNAVHQTVDVGTTTYTANVTSNTSPVFATGTAYLKLVISFNLD